MTMRGVRVDELRIKIEEGGVQIEWRHAPQYPAPWMQELSWEPVERGFVEIDFHVERALRQQIENGSSILKRFVEHANQFESAQHRVVVPLDDYFDPYIRKLLFSIYPQHSVLLVLETDAGPGKRSPSTLSFPVDVAFERQEDLRNVASTLAAAAQSGLLSLSEIWDTTSSEETPANVIWQLGVYTDPDEIRAHLRSGSQPPRLVILDGPAPPGWSILLAEKLIEEGCPAVVVSRWRWMEPRSMRALYEQLFLNKPLDLAISRAKRDSTHFHDAILVCRKDHYSTRLISQAMFEHKHEGGVSLEKIRLAHADPWAEGELRQFLANRAQRIQREAETVLQTLDEIEVDGQEPFVNQVTHILAHSSEIARRWRRLCNLFTDPDRLTSLAFGDLALPGRYTRAWVMGKNGEPHPDKQPLEINAPYTLKIQISYAHDEQPYRQQMPIQELVEVFGDEQAIHLDVFAFAKTGEVRLEANHTRIALPRFGESGTASLGFSLPPNLDIRTARRLRIGIYCANRLLQSMAIDLTLAVGSQTTYELDYVESKELLIADELPRLRVSFFLNDGPDGTHRLGIVGLTEPKFLNLDATFIHSRSEALRTRYQMAQDLDGKHLYAPERPWDDDNWVQRRKALVDVARLGKRTFFSIFEAGELNIEDIDELRKALRTPDGVLQFARCREHAPGLPWAALYDYPLDAEKSELCKVFEADILNSRRGRGRKRLDYLEDPSACASRKDCPLRARPDPTVVCPFGLLGLRHRIEQPPYALSRENASVAKPQNSSTPHSIASTAISQPERRNLMTVGYWQFNNAQEHLRSLRKLIKPHAIRFDAAEGEEHLCQILGSDDNVILYFYCHGDEYGDAFALRLGSRANNFKFTADHLMQWRDLEWPQKRWSRSPLVILNGCETLAVTPGRLNEFRVVLLNCGASGVVGPEVPVFTSTASRIGEWLIGRFLNGQPLGDALRAMQRELMRELNPIGLMYAAYAPADLVFNPNKGIVERGQTTT